MSSPEHNCLRGNEVARILGASNPRLWHMTVSAQVSIVAWGPFSVLLSVNHGLRDCWEDVLLYRRDWINMCHQVLSQGIESNMRWPINLILLSTTYTDGLIQVTTSHTSHSAIFCRLLPNVRELKAVHLQKGRGIHVCPCSQSNHYPLVTDASFPSEHQRQP